MGMKDRIDEQIVERAEQLAPAAFLDLANCLADDTT